MFDVFSNHASPDLGIVNKLDIILSNCSILLSKYKYDGIRNVVDVLSEAVSVFTKSIEISGDDVDNDWLIAVKILTALLIIFSIFI